MKPKKPLKLPKAIAPPDIKKIFQVTPNLKHNTMLKLCYGLGLRVSEIVNLKIKDIDSKSMQVFIERAKGKKDRYVNLPESILPQLRNYFIFTAWLNFFNLNKCLVHGILTYNRVNF